MKTVFFSISPYEEEHFREANSLDLSSHELIYHSARLDETTASLAAGAPCVCVFVNDIVNASVLKILHAQGTRLIACRSAGFNHVDLEAAKELGLTVVRVPAYSPYAVAEHTVGLLLTLNRQIHRAHNRVREGNFSLNGLVGFDLHGKTVGIIGTGKIGTIVAKILTGFGCKTLAHDPYPNSECEQLGVNYVDLVHLLTESDIISLHCPLDQKSHHLINESTIAAMKPGVVLINTSRGGLVDTKAVIDALKSGHISKLALDVYEEEGDLFFHDCSDSIIKDDQIARLLTFPNVLITGHQAFLTEEALQAIASTTLDNISTFEASGLSPNAVSALV